MSHQLKGAAWARLVAAVRARRDPCARCGQPIDYDGPRYILDRYGRRHENPLAFDCGHILPRAVGGALTLTNLQAEHVACNRKAGARLGARRRWGVRLRPASAARW